MGEGGGGGQRVFTLSTAGAGARQRIVHMSTAPALTPRACASPLLPGPALLARLSLARVLSRALALQSNL